MWPVLHYMYEGLIVLFIVFLNAFFVLAEFSLVRIRKSRLEELIEQGEERAKTVLEMSEHLDTYVSACQIGITVSSLLLGWFFGPRLADFILDIFNVEHLTWYAESLSLIMAFICMVLLHVILGELVPRSLAIAKVEKSAMFVAGPLQYFHSFLYPLVIFTNALAKGVLKLLGFKSVPREDIAKSEDELRMIVSASERGGELDKVESRLIDNVFDFSDRVAKEIMVPRQDMSCLYADKSLAENLQTVRESNHTRYPLCLADKDHMLGMIHVRDLMNISRDTDTFDMRSIMREIMVVPESMSTGKILQLMQHKHLQIAVVADEYGGTAGLVTLEDLVEEIVGDIQDEHDKAKLADVVHLPDGSYEFDGLVLLDEVSELLNVDFEEPEEDTIGGYIFGILGRRPERGDKVTSHGYKFEVLQATGFRIMRIKAEKVPEEQVVHDDAK